MFESDLESQAGSLFRPIAIEDYNSRFKALLVEIYALYKQMIKDKIVMPKHEDKITEILVDKYLRRLNNYSFKREKKNNRGLIDIYIVEGFSESEPEFLIECKVLNNKNLTGERGKNAEYVRNGIYRFLSEHYFSYNDLYTNAMIAYIVDDLEIEKNIDNLNVVSENIIGKLVDITQKISIEEVNIYKSIYKTIRDKEFTLYHLMMDFSKNIS